MARSNDLGHDPIGRLVLRLAIPSMLAQFVNELYSIVDRMYIGHIPVVGDLALAGAGVCGPIVTLISSFSFLVGLGGAPLMAIRLGEGDKAGAKKILSNAFLVLCILAGTLIWQLSVRSNSVYSAMFLSAACFILPVIALLLFLY